MNWDDTESILNNPAVRQFSFAKSFSHFTLGNYHPLTDLSFVLEQRFAQLNPFVVHLDNVLLHLCNTALVYWLILLLIPNAATAAIVAVLFGIHPMHVESVAWATERKDVLYAFFYLLALITYDKRKLSLTLIFFILSLLSKVQAITFPLACVALDLYRGRKFQQYHYFIFSIIFGCIALVGAKLTGAYHMSGTFNLFDRILLASLSLAVYMVKLIVPFQVACMYPYPLKSSSGFMMAGGASLVFILGVTVFFLKNIKDRMIIFGASFFLFNIFLGLQLVTVGHAFMADRFTYVSSIGLFLLIAIAFEKYRRPIVTAGLAAYILVLSLVSFVKCQVWHDGASLWSNVIEQFPDSYEAFLYRGDHYAKTGVVDKALNDYAASIVLKNDFAKTYVNRGNLWQALGKFDLAIADFNKALVLRPQSLDILMNRANALAQDKQYNLALKDYDHLLSIDPHNAQVIYNRGVMFYQKSKQMGN